MSGISTKLSIAAALALFLPAQAAAQVPVESPLFAQKVASGQLPPIAERLPKQTMTVDLEAKGRRTGQPGGEIVTLVPRARDIRYLSAYAYSRLVGYDDNLTLKPTSSSRSRSRVRTASSPCTLREGHRWSDGHPFTTEDFRYFWEDIAQNKDLMPAACPTSCWWTASRPVRGPSTPARYATRGTSRTRASSPNSRAARPVHLPARALPQAVSRQVRRQGALDETAKKQKLKSWAALHNRLDDMNEQTNPTCRPCRPGA
jgi:peptide/nickel transport system substrate-binding protein